MQMCSARFRTGSKNNMVPANLVLAAAMQLYITGHARDENLLQ